MERTRSANKPACALIIGALLLLVGIGCDEEESPVVSDTDQLTTYINSDAVARELFRTDGLITKEPYFIPNDPDSVEYRDSLVSMTRTITVVIGDSASADYGALGLLREAVVQVRDVFTLEVIKVDGADTTTIENERALNRIGFFLKLGNDAQPFLGWSLWGFNGLGAVTSLPYAVGVNTPNGTFRGDVLLYTETLKSILTSLPFIRLSQLNDIAPGDEFETVVVNSSNLNRFYPRVNYRGPSGFVTRRMEQVSSDSVRYVDTLTNPVGNPLLYNVLFMQTFREEPGQYLFSRAFCVPFRSRN